MESIVRLRSENTINTNPINCVPLLCCVSETEQAHTSLQLMSAPLQVHDFDLQGVWSLDTEFIFLKLQLDIPALNLRVQLNHRSHNMSGNPTTGGKKRVKTWSGERGKTVSNEKAMIAFLSLQMTVSTSMTCSGQGHLEMTR